MYFRGSIRIFALLSGLIIAAGCRTNDELKLDERDRFSPGGRISYEIYPGLDRRRQGALIDLVTRPSDQNGEEAVTARSAGIQPTIAVVGEIAHVEGSDRQQVQAGRQVELDVVIVGPARVKLNADNLRASLAARGGVRFFDVLSLEAILGLRIDKTEVRLRGNGLSGTDEDVRAGLLVGARATVRPIPHFDLYVQYTESLLDHYAGFGGLGVTTSELQAGIDLNLTRNIAIFAGYRWWTYEEESLASGSDWDIDIRGPTAGASLKF